MGCRIARPPCNANHAAAKGGCLALDEMEELLRRIPKAELHVHLRGAMPKDLLMHLLNKYSTLEVWREAPAEWRSLFEVYDNVRPFLSPSHRSVEDVVDLLRTETFEQFVATYAFAGCYIRTASDFRRLVLGVVEGLEAQNVVYAEITASIQRHVRNGISLADIGACLDEGASYGGIKVRWILCLVRDYGKEEALRLIGDVIVLGCESIVGITLAGTEHRFPPAEFADVFALARDHGLHLTAHAGEMLGPQSVWDALQILGVERIGHGVRAVEDQHLVQHLAEHQIPLEVCPTSNLRTGIFPSYEAHAVKALFDAGVPVTIGTDDPTFFGTTLADEYVHLRDLGFRDRDLCEMLENGFRCAFLPADETESYLHVLRSAWSELSPPTPSG